MQEVVYRCDHCQQVIGKRKHISLSFGQHSGIAKPPTAKTTYWEVAQKLQGKFLHFCNGKCIGGYFRNLIIKTK